jgi:hypothetical protein
MERMSTVQLGQIAGAAEFRLPDKIPAIKVPCLHAKLFACAQVALFSPRISRKFSVARLACWTRTGPSMSPIFTSGLPLVRSISAVSLINSSGDTYVGNRMATHYSLIPETRLVFLRKRELPGARIATVFS